MAVSKVTLVQNNVSQTLIDVSQDTAVPADVAQGKTFHDAQGIQQVGIATGTSKPTQTKTATPTTSQQSITPDAGYELASVTVEAVTNSIDANIQAGNIKDGVTILGVTGNYTGGGGGSSTFLRELVERYSLTTINAADLTGITSIGPYAFAECQNLVSGTLPNTVTSIANHAFYNCLNLTDTMITNNIMSVGDNAYYGCVSLSTLAWSTNVTSIPYGCFMGCGFVNPIIPDYVTYVGDNAFADNQNLETITFGTGLTSLGYNVLSNCPNLSYVTFMSSTPPTSYEQYPFDMSTLMFIRVPDAAVATYQATYPWSQYTIQGLSDPIVLTTPANLFRFDVDGHITKYTGTRGRVITPTSYDKLTSSQTFNGIYAYLENFPSQSSSFAGLTVTISPDGDINNASTFDETTIGNVPSQFGSYGYIMGVSATQGDYSNLPNISWLISPSGYPLYINGTIIYDASQYNDYWNSGSLVQETKVFYGTGTVVSYTDGNTYQVTAIDADAFSDMGMPNSYLTNLKVSEGVTTIGEGNFNDSYILTKVSLPSTLTTLGLNFTGCSQLSPSNFTFESNSYFSIDSNGTICYSNDNFTTKEIVAQLAYVSGTLYIPSSVSSVRDYAFRNSQINYIYFEQGFAGTLGSYLFDSCLNLYGVYFNDLSTTINFTTYTFNPLSNVSSLTLPPTGMSTTGLSISSTYLTQLDISRTSITYLAVQGATSLSSITWNTSVQTVNLQNCGFATLSLPTSVTTISSLANNSSLSSLTLDTSVSSIAGYAFANDSNLTSITVNATTPPTCDADAFTSSSISTVYVPDAVVATYQAAPYWSNLTILGQGSGPSSPTATVYFDSMGQPGSYTVDLAQNNYTLDFSSDSSVYGVDIGMSSTDWVNANGTIIGYSDNILARQFNSGNVTYICYVSDGEISIPSSIIPTSGGTNSGTCTVSLSGAGISSQTATITITDYNSYYECVIVPMSGTDFVQIDMILTDDLRAVSSYTLTTSVSVPLPYIVSSNTITGTTELLSGDLVLPSSYSLDNGDVVEGNDYAITQISLQTDHANDFADITQLTIPSNYVSADVQGSMDNLTMLILEGNSLQYFYFASTTITTLRCMTTVPPTIDAQAAAYIDSISNLTTIEVPYSAISAYQSSNWGLTNKTITYIPGTEPQDTVTVYREDGQGGYLIDGVVDLTTVSNVMPGTVNGQLVDSGEYCVMGSGVTNLIINTDGLIYATWLFNGTDAQSQNIDFTIPRGLMLNYGLGSDPDTGITDTHFVMNDYNQLYILQTYDAYPGQVGYAKLMDYSKNVVTSGTCDMYYFDPMTSEIYWRITDTNSIETYVKVGQIDVSGNYYTTVEVVNQPTIPNSADEFSFNGNSITGYYGGSDSPITPTSYDTSNAYTDGALVSMSEWNSFYTNMESDSCVGTITLMVEGESNARTYTTGSDINDLETQVGSVNLYIQSIVLADTVQASGSGYVIDMVSNALQFPIKIGNFVLYGTDQVTSWYDAHSNVYSYQFSGSYTAFIDGYSHLVTTIGSIDSGNSSTWLNSIVISEGVTTISDNAFDSQTMMAAVDLPSTITTIGNYAFTGLTLSSIIIRATTPPTLGTDSFDAGVTIQVPAEAVSDYQNDSSYSGFTITSIQ